MSQVEQVNNSNNNNNEASSSKRPTDTKPTDNKPTDKPNKKHYKGRGRKKNTNVVNATEAGTPESVKPTEESVKSEEKKDETKPLQKKRNNNNKRKPKATEQNGTPAARITKNRAQGRLTEPQDDAASDTASVASSKNNKKRNRNRTRQPKLPPGDHDMATLLAHELKTSTYECMICMDVVRPAHHTWTCDCCWAVFHLNCVQTWASKSLKGKH